MWTSVLKKRFIHSNIALYLDEQDPNLNLYCLKVLIRNEKMNLNFGI